MKFSLGEGVRGGFAFASMGKGGGESLRGHERKLFTDAASNDGGIDYEAGDNVIEGAKKNVGGEESLWKGDSSNCTTLFRYQ